MLILAYITGIVLDKPGQGGFTVTYGTSDAAFTSNATFYVDLQGSEGEIEDAIRVKVAAAVNAALGTQFTMEEVRLF